MLIALIIVGVVIVVVIAMYNGLVRLKVQCDNAWSDIDVQLKRRYDLIPNLVETVKGYAGHEKETLEGVIAARNQAISATGPAAKAGAENMLTGALRQLFAVAEAYPDLKASTNFQQLQAELTDLENKIAAARRFFNNAVGEYNASIQRFPAVLIAGAAGFQPREFFDVGADRAALQSAPQVKFS